jgi:hypothetical protein
MYQMVNESLVEIFNAALNTSGFNVDYCRVN